MIKDNFQTPDSKTTKAQLKRKLQYSDQKGSGILKKPKAKYFSW